MTVTRRTFIRSGAMSVLAASIALDSVPRAFAQQLRKADPTKDFLVSSEAQREVTYRFTRDTFQPYIGGVFKLSAGASSVEATLVSVRDCTPNPDPKKKITHKSRSSDSFALVFRAEGKLTDLTTIYDVEHGALGKFPLFLTRREDAEGTSFYEAVFNHAL